MLRGARLSKQQFDNAAGSISVAIRVYPVHLNPRVREPVFRLLANRDNVHLAAPAPYPEFV